LKFTLLTVVVAAGVLLAVAAASPVFFIKFLVEKLRVANIVVMMAP
jgi:hypothetical protein